MPRKASPERKKALEMWLSSGGAKPLRTIANQLGVPEKTVSAWKVRDKWEDAKKVERNTTNDKKCSTASAPTKRKRGAQPGNHNNPGNPNFPPPPKGSKRALKTGEFERILFSDLTPQEKEMIAQGTDDPLSNMMQEIILCAIREKRMLGRLRLLADKESGSRTGMMLVNTRLHGKPVGPSPIGDSSNKDGVKPDSVENQSAPILDKIMSIEEALTRIQTSRVRAIKELHNIIKDNRIVELEEKRVASEIGEALTQDDGFLEALCSTGKKVFKDGMDRPQGADTEGGAI